MEGKFLSEAGKKAQQQEAQTTEFDKRFKLIRAITCLIGWDSMLIYMIMAGKIDTLFGVLFVAVFSVIFGRMTK
jgi:hypothetical protein